MAFGDYATLLDDFNRSNEGPPLSANWTTVLGAGLKVISNACQAGTTEENAELWTAATIGPDVEAYVTITTKIGVSQGVAVYCRISDLGSGGDGYLVFPYVKSGLPDRWYLYRLDNGTPTAVGSYYEQEFASGDKFGMSMEGSAWKAYWSDQGAAWAEVRSETDATYSITGNAGLEVDDETGVLDDFYAGEIVEPTGRIMSSLVDAGGLAGFGGIAGRGGGLAG